MIAKTQDSPSKNTQLADRSTRLLLALWALGKKGVPKSKLTDRITRKSKDEKSNDYKEVFEKLVDIRAITIDDIPNGKKTNSSKERDKKEIKITAPGISLSISDEGIKQLRQHLKNTDLLIEEGTVVGSWMAKALLQWIQQEEAISVAPKSNGKVSNGAISSYEEFKPEALNLFEKLDKGYNYGGLVPIWHMRREMGDRVGREEFSDWMMELQAEQEFYLQTGASREVTEDQKRDSITNEIRGILFYASKPE